MRVVHARMTDTSFGLPVCLRSCLAAELHGIHHRNKKGKNESDYCPDDGLMFRNTSILLQPVEHYTHFSNPYYEVVL